MAGGHTGPNKNPSESEDGKIINLEELKSFFNFLQNQEYIIPSEADNNINSVITITNNSDNNRNSSPCPSVCSGKRSSSTLSSESDGSEQSGATVKGLDEDEGNSYQVVRRKPKRVTRRQIASSQNIKETQPIPMEVASLESPASPDFSVGQVAISATKQVRNDGKNIRTVGSKPPAPPWAKIPPPVCLRDKSKWKAVSAECSRQRIQYTRAQNTNVLKLRQQLLMTSASSIVTYLKMTSLFTRLRSKRSASSRRFLRESQ
ncbi:hypothetical protein EVAR_97324_1 [Eumeta japonica]|uniref:Uncharacterized protein n=1 Tax=Eumeta variegata TaxID=151549 RepID=A0A4C1X5C3_EUMVA|nr:hypothetical protein EVAR_97324_1 [Eumeta japonica]